MSWRDLFSSKIKCPNCGRDGAEKVGNGYKCTNPHCKWYDAGTAPSEATQKIMTPIGSVQGPPPAGYVVVMYRNFRGESKTFNVLADSAIRKKNHWVVKTSAGRTGTVYLRDPQTGEPRRMNSSDAPGIVLSRDRIQNLSDFEAALPQRVAPGQDLPTARERQVLNYHKKYKTTSPLYEQIRAKYPNW